MPNRFFPGTESFAGHEFDAIAVKVAGDLGLQHLEVTKLRRVHSPEWNRRIRLLPNGADARLEARRLVEQTLLAEAENYLPITGGDVMDFLGVKPGPEVGKYLRRARELYRSELCSREVLLERLKSVPLTTCSA